MNHDFSSVLNIKLAHLQEKIKDLNNTLASPNYHAGRLTDTLRSAVGQIDANKDSASIVNDLIALINQIPTFVGEGLASGIRENITLKQEETLLVSLLQEYNSWAKAKEDFEKQQKEKQERLIDDIAIGNISEPGRKLGEPPDPNRKPGMHPGPTIRDVRKAKAVLDKRESKKEG